VKLPRFRFFTTVGGGLGIFGSESDITSISSTPLLVIGIRILIHIYLVKSVEDSTTMVPVEIFFIKANSIVLEHEIEWSFLVHWFGGHCK
jgi:hypothetical protein